MEIKTSAEIAHEGYESDKKWISVDSLFDFFESFTIFDKDDLEDYLNEKGD